MASSTFASFSSKRMVALIIAAAVAAAVYVPAKAWAKQYVVGDERGWTNNFDYATWAEGKTFFVGDSLVFNYPAGKHNVFKVNGTDFQDCAKPLAAAPPLTSGSDEIPLKTAGKKWYICGVSGHCASGQKLVITVSEGSAPPAGYSSSGVAMVNIGFAALVLVGTLGMLFF
ncbi:unnamed protein product [Linum tenue]|uniref:Phytocyanin domain-containing protein n=1 Tax=Linum tenue TaxID=586396 RepID=A0AAV0K501_9ROSI|nr:unnamed protein product [Linum tenue]